MLLDSLEKESLGVKASEQKSRRKKDKKEEIKPKLGWPSSLKNKEFKSKETLPSDSDSDDMNPREKVNLYKSSDSEADTKPAAKTKKNLLSSIFATKNKKAREVSDSGSEKEENPGRAIKSKKKKREKEKKKKREKERSKRSKRRRDSDSSDEDVSFDESSPKKGKPPSSPLSSASSSPSSKLSPSHKASSYPPPPHLGDRTCGRPTQPKARSQHVTDSPRVKNPSNSSPHSSSSRSPLYYPEVKAPTGVKSLASPLSPLSPGGDVKQEVEAKNGNRVGRMEQGDEEEEDGEINGNEEEEEVVPPYCQPNHKPFPPIEELQDRRYWAKLQTINAAINDPNTGQDQLNQIVDLILETGNFSTSPDRFNFDICNLEKSVVHQIAEVP